MDLQPKDLYEKLEFDKIIHLLARECSGELGQQFFAELRPSTHLKTIEQQLKEAKELLNSIQEERKRFSTN